MVPPTIGGPLPAEVRTIQIGEEASGSLTGDDATLAGGFSYDVWEFQGQVGQIVQVDMISETVLLDPYLIAINQSGEGELGRNDDGGGRTTASFQIRLQRPTPYRVVATTFGIGQRGSYTFRVTSLFTPVADSISLVSIEPAPGIPIARGTEVTFTAAVSYMVASADSARIGIVIQDQEDRGLLTRSASASGPPLGVTISRGRGTVTLTDRVGIPAIGVTAVNVYIPLFPQGAIGTATRVLVTYPVQ
jgi:hypothetical protein